MGAVATLEAAAETHGYEALILDSPFASLRGTVVRHSWLFLKMPPFPFPSIFLFWFQRLTHVDPDRVDARNALKRIEPVPMLFLTSEGDQRISAETVRGLYERAETPAKQLKVFGTDVPHGASARLHPEEYDATLLSFLDRVATKRYSRGSGPPSLK
jgi:fermentation-respiration switch protein FrsA (DUF1100 family)